MCPFPERGLYQQQEAQLLRLHQGPQLEDWAELAELEALLAEAREAFREAEVAVESFLHSREDCLP